MTTTRSVVHGEWYAVLGDEVVVLLPPAAVKLSVPPFRVVMPTPPLLIWVPVPLAAEMMMLPESIRELLLWDISA